jgi:membrane-associated phospholipid phosphatase
MVRRPATALLASGGCVAFAVLVWALVFHTRDGRAADIAAFAGFAHLNSTPASPLADVVASLCNTGPFALFSAIIVLWALRSRGPRWALAAMVVLGASNVVTQVLKAVLAAPRMVAPLADGAGVEAASWPSGHSTAAMALALAAVLAAPPAARRLTAIAGGLFAIAVAYSVVLLGWHMPSDVLGGFAITGAVTGLVTAALGLAEDRWPAGAGRRAATRALGAGDPPWAARLAVLGAVAVIAAVVARIALWLPSPEHRAAFLVTAAAIVALGLVLSAGAARLQRT